MPASPRIASTADVAHRLQPVVVGGDILAYSYVRELHRAYGVERTIVLATQDIKMLSSSRFTDYRLEPLIHEPEGLYDALERVAAQVRAEDPDRVLLVLGCDDCHARMLSSGKPRLEAAGYTVPTSTSTCWTTSRRSAASTSCATNWTSPTPHLVLRLQRERPGRAAGAGLPYR